jgi:phage terminase small subunit
LIERHETAAETANREGKDAALRPGRKLTTYPPAQLKGHKIAQKAWRRLMRLYGELEAEIVTRMDIDMLVDYCMLIEQVQELDQMRKSAVNVWETLERALDEFDGDEKGRYQLAINVGNALNDVVKFDGRADRKRDLLFKLRQSLYITPRARAGSIPSQKKPEEPMDPVAQMLDNVTTFVNKGGRHVR